MRFDDALRELGVEHDANDDAIRRAYLRLLKTRKPEVDPEGFKRLREAYEVAKNARGWMPVEPPQAKRVDAGTPAEAKADAGAEAKAEAEAEAEGEAEADAKADAPKPLAFPSMEEIATLLEADKPIAAGKRMRACFDAARVNHGVVLPPLGLVMGTILRLCENDRLDSASALHASVKRWLAMTGDEARILGAGFAVPWALTSEIVALPSSLDSKMRAELARGVREGDPSRAQDRLYDLHVLEPAAAKEIAYLLRTRAPMLASAMGDALTKRRQLPKDNSFSLRWLWIPAVILIQIGRVATRASHDMPREPVVAAYRPSTGALQTARASAGPPASAWARDAARSAEQLAKTAHAGAWDDVQSAAMQMRDALDDGSCEDARTLMPALFRAVAAGHTGAATKLAPDLAVFERSFTRACGAIPTQERESP